MVVAISAGAMSFDTHRGFSTFLSTRATGMWVLVATRFTVNATAAALAYTLGLLAAWYETALLLGSLPVGAMLAGLLCESVYLVSPSPWLPHPRRLRAASCPQSASPSRR